MKPKPSETAKRQTGGCLDCREGTCTFDVHAVERAYLLLRVAAKALLDDLGTPGGVVNTAYLRKILEEDDEQSD